MDENNAPILIVDDEPEMCWIMENIIHKMGFPSRKALNAREAITLTESNKFVMAFLDDKLPDIDGIELARQIHKTNTGMPIALVSGFFYQKDPLIEEIIHNGLIVAFIGKPFVHHEIVNVITRYASR